MENRNRIVIVGGSFAGIAAVKALLPYIATLNLDITLVERRDCFYYNPAALRATVDRTVDKKLFIPYWSLLKNYPRTRFIQASVTHIHNDRVVYEVDGVEVSVGFDYLVIATGSDYGFPLKCAYGGTQQGLDELEAIHTALESSERVAVVGAGPAGCELAGEIKSQFPNKHVTLVHARDQVCTGVGDDSFRARVLGQLRSLGVEVRLGERVQATRPSGVWNHGNVLETDMQFWCTGTSRPHVAFLDTLSQDLVVEGRVHVRDTLQLQGFDHIFCPGDVNDTAGPKLAYTARWQGQHVAASIIRLIQHKPVSAYCSLLPTGLVVVPLGKSSGVTYVPYAGNWGSWLTWLVKGRDLFLPSTWRDLKLAPP